MSSYTVSNNGHLITTDEWFRDGKEFVIMYDGMYISITRPTLDYMGRTSKNHYNDSFKKMKFTVFGQLPEHGEWVVDFQDEDLTILVHE